MYHCVLGPDIGGKPGGESDIETEALGPGAIAGIVVAVIIGVGIGVAILVYCIIVWRRKEEEKEVARSMSVLFPTTGNYTDLEISCPATYKLLVFMEKC